MDNIKNIKVTREFESKQKQEYLHDKIETKWMNRWYKDNLYCSNDSSNKQKYFALDMFPYPSGSGLHVGHVEGYSATDIQSRFKRMQGLEVLHPMGWDAFGLPTENFAIKSGRNPNELTGENIATFKSQCLRVGLGIDWKREINTSSPEYYKWTQWLFLKLYEKGLAYKKKSYVNWDPIDQTVLANEQILPDGTAERSGAKVVKKEMEQWYFKITEYSDRLITDLDKLDWPESTKKGQINWIGRSEGYQIDFPLLADKKTYLHIFTKTPEMLLASTYVVIAPEHHLVDKFTLKDKKNEIDEYIKNSLAKTDTERMKGNKIISGIFTGSYVVNPLTSEQLPVYVSENVITDDVNNTIMGVPGHNKRDFSFAKRNNLNITYILKPSEGTLDTTKPYLKNEGLIMSSGYEGSSIEESRIKIIKDLGNRIKPITSYKLKDWLVSRERYWGAPIPIAYTSDNVEIPIPEKDLPIILPSDIADYRPKGKAPLSQSESFMQIPNPFGSGEVTREPKTLDTFVDSSFYFLRFCDPNNNGELAGKAKMEKWMPVDLYIGGAEHTVGHLLYSRFITKVLYDMGYINFDEPFKKLRHQGIVLGEDHRTMSKRWGNVIRPDQIAEKYGADSLRLYEMFMGPLEQAKPWSTDGLIGVNRFVNRVWKMIDKVIVSQTEDILIQDEKNINSLINKVTSHFEQGKYNLAVSEYMKYLNGVEKLGSISKDSFEKFLLVLAPLAPFIAEELWERIGNEYSIHLQNWPSSSEVKEETIVLSVQINGKFRGTLKLDSSIDFSEEEIIDLAKTQQDLSKYLHTEKYKKIIYIPKKVINIIL